MALDPYALTPAASLNRVRLVSGRRLSLPEHLEGRTAGEVLSGRAIHALAAEYAGRSGLRFQDTVDLTELLSAWSSSASEAECRAATDVLEEHGARLAYLIAVLKLGEPAARAARPEWDQSYWRAWGGIEAVALCGGLASAALAETAGRVLTELGIACNVRVAPHAAIAPLIGAARSIRSESGTAFVFDCGGTSVKRAIAGYEAGMLTSLRVLDAVPAPLVTGDRSPQLLANLICEPIRLHGGASRAAINVAMSIASYVRDNHLLEPPHASYVDLSGIENLGAWLGEQIALTFGVPSRVQLVHDGTASALSVSPAAHVAAITTGTSLGLGFARQTGEGLTGQAPGFRVEGGV